MKQNDRQQQSMEDHQPICTATNSSATPTRKSSLSAECESCVSYLTRALDRAGSKQQSLLRAMGVVTHRTSGEEEKIYRRSQDGRGILVQLKSSRTPVSNKSIANHSSGAEGADSGEAGKAVRRRTAGSIKEQTQIIDNGNGTTSTTTLRNRLTQAASQLVEGIRHSADDIIHNDSVLSTSPNDEGNHVNQRRHTKKPTLTTIAIECQQCGSDTRAEAGARAYVKGPEPLSIVLCSNRLSSQREIDEVLTHELIHIYDIKKKRMDLTNCKELAYSEIRAAREAECGNSLTAYTQLICVKDKATVATKNMFPDEGRACVCNVFDEAMNDHTPFASLQSHSRNPHRASDR
mmetsp:Transcript_25613/g.39360  ORF Transcript_25613/g.39360 Transcript_25613/m.39360 type:complete len:348 (+) Transcript_25613:183-1226(+)